MSEPSVRHQGRIPSSLKFIRPEYCDGCKGDIFLKALLCVRCGDSLRNVKAITTSALRRDADMAESLPKELSETAE
jgi:hypothetical protein